MSLTPESPPLSIRPFADENDAGHCARIIAHSEPWLTLGCDETFARRVAGNTSRERYAAYAGERFAGFVILNLNGPIAGYIQTVGVDAGMRGAGVGTALVTFAEARIFREYPNVFLSVSSFNAGARQLYERLGYAVVGVLKDYLVQGYDEILMRKTRGAVFGYVPP